MYAFMPEVTIPEFKISNKSHKLLLVGEGEMDNYGKRSRASIYMYKA